MWSEFCHFWFWDYEANGNCTQLRWDLDVPVQFIIQCLEEVSLKKATDSMYSFHAIWSLLDVCSTWIYLHIDNIKKLEKIKYSQFDFYPILPLSLSHTHFQRSSCSFKKLFFVFFFIFLFLVISEQHVA